MDLVFGTAQDNDRIGYMAILRDPEAAEESQFTTKSGRTEKEPFRVLLGIVNNVPDERDVRIFCPQGEDAIDNQKRFRQFMEAAGHEGQIEIFEGPDGGGVFKTPPPSGSLGRIFDRIQKQARAAAWGVSLNPNALTPGGQIGGSEAQTLHQTAHANGFEEGAIRLLLAEYGFISASEVTRGLYDRVKKRLSSSAVAELYNKKYDQVSS